jgi:hypothetical protein
LFAGFLAVLGVQVLGVQDQAKRRYGVSSLSMAHGHLWIYSNSADFILPDDELKHTVEVYTQQCNWNQSTSLMKVECHEWSVWIL